MQMPPRPNAPYHNHPHDPQNDPYYQHAHRPRRRRRSRFRRFVRGYLMTVGAMTTIYVLIQLLVLLFIEIGKWMPSQPVI